MAKTTTAVRERGRAIEGVGEQAAAVPLTTFLAGAGTLTLNQRKLLGLRELDAGRTAGRGGVSGTHRPRPPHPGNDSQIREPLMDRGHRNDSRIRSQTAPVSANASMRISELTVAR